MPIYEYQCPQCQAKFELRRSFSEADINIACPTCQSGAKRLLSTFASFSKGSGGESAPIGGSGSSCGSCSGSSCATCR